MLLVGVWRHGLGNWELIRDDAGLHLADKFFLEDAKRAKDEKKADGDNKTAKVVRTPGAIHLVRRAEYLLKALQEVETARKGTDRRERSPSSAQSPAPGQMPRKKPSKPKLPKAKDSSVPPVASSSKAGHLSTNGSNSSKSQQHSLDDEEGMDDDACKALMRPVKKELKELKNGTDHLPREAKIEALKRCLSGIKRRIDQVVAEVQGSTTDKETRRKHCWIFTSYFWSVSSSS